MHTVAVARHAMATRFEIVLLGDDPVRLRAAGEEALREIERLETQLSFYRADSDITRLNQHAAAGPVRIDPRLFRLLQQAQTLSRETQGAFDITIAPLLRAWGFVGGTGQLPEPEELAAARACVGMSLVELNEADFTVRFLRDGVLLDFGSLGKGYALEQAADILREAGIERALLHGGTSTVYAIGAPPDAEAWSIAIDDPSAEPSTSSQRRAPWVTVPLRDAALSVSGVRGKAFTANGRVYGHVLDPRKGEPLQGAVLAAVVLPSATESDALSTALLVSGVEGHEALAALRPEMKALVVEDNPRRVGAHGLAVPERA